MIFSDIHKLKMDKLEASLFWRKSHSNRPTDTEISNVAPCFHIPFKLCNVDVLQCIPDRIDQLFSSGWFHPTFHPPCSSRIKRIPRAHSMFHVYYLVVVPRHHAMPSYCSSSNSSSNSTGRENTRCLSHVIPFRVLIIIIITITGASWDAIIASSQQLFLLMWCGLLVYILDGWWCAAFNPSAFDRPERCHVFVELDQQLGSGRKCIDRFKS